MRRFNNATRPPIIIRRRPMAITCHLSWASIKALKKIPNMGSKEACHRRWHMEGTTYFRSSASQHDKDGIDHYEGDKDCEVA